MALTRLGLNQAINLATNTTGTLGVANGGTGLTSGTTDQFLKFTGSTTVASAAVSAGISMADQWRLTTTFQGDANPIASNLERVDTNGQGYIGSAMTQSSGIFTFPSTGVYKIEFNADCYRDGDTRYMTGYIYGTTDNSNYNIISANRLFIQRTDSNHTSNSLVTSTLFDVTSTSNCKVKFRAETENNSAYFYGNTDQNATYMTFIRLGDT